MRARKIFEARMYEAGIPFGPSPGEGYPDDLVPEYETAGTQNPCQGPKSKPKRKR